MFRLATRGGIFLPISVDSLWWWVPWYRPGQSQIVGSAWCISGCQRAVGAMTQDLAKHSPLGPGLNRIQYSVILESVCDRPKRAMAQYTATYLQGQRFGARTVDIVAGPPTPRWALLLLRNANHRSRHEKILFFFQIIFLTRYDHLLPFPHT